MSPGLADVTAALMFATMLVVAADLLALAIKSVDRIGHDYGPRSQEQLDVLVRLDRLLGDLFRRLDAAVGEGAWVAAISADHGAPNIAEYELERGRPGRRVSEEELRSLLDDIEEVVAAHPLPPERLA